PALGGSTAAGGGRGKRRRRGRARRRRGQTIRFALRRPRLFLQRVFSVEPRGVQAPRPHAHQVDLPRDGGARRRVARAWLRVWRAAAPVAAGLGLGLGLGAGGSPGRSRGVGSRQHGPGRAHGHLRHRDQAGPPAHSQHSRAHQLDARADAGGRAGPRVVRGGRGGRARRRVRGPGARRGAVHVSRVHQRPGVIHVLVSRRLQLRAGHRHGHPQPVHRRTRLPGRALCGQSAGDHQRRHRSALGHRKRRPRHRDAEQPRGRAGRHRRGRHRL
ncbi:hypothetical protein H632_c4504p0, partial [Helicosporidium sp. ATCC 50920]